MSKRPTILDDRTYDYLLAHAPLAHAILEDVMRQTARRGDASMQVSQEQAALLKMLTQLHNPKRVLEIGCFTGASAIAMAAGMAAGGQLVTCDIDPETSALAESFFREAGFADTIALRLGPAMATIAELHETYGPESFDQVFIDADKENYLNYYESAFTLLRPGGLILVDNVLWSGKVVEPGKDSATIAIQAFNERIKVDDRVNAVMMHVADGLYLIRKK